MKCIASECASLIVPLVCAVLTGCASQRDVNVGELLRVLESYDVDESGSISMAAGGSATEPEEVSEPEPVDIPDAPAAPLPGPAIGEAEVTARPGSPPESTNAPARSAASPGVAERAVLTIQPECLVQITVDEDPSLDGSYPVNNIGAVSLGYVGPVILYNKTEEEAAAKIRDVLENRDFRRATVRVRILRASYDKIRVGGLVGRGGTIKIGAGDAISLEDALLRAGGVRGDAVVPVARITRGGMMSPMPGALEAEEYPLTNEDGRPSIPDVLLRNNDIISVVSQGVQGPGSGLKTVAPGVKDILVLGEVKRQGMYRFKGTEPCSILYLTLKMGGFPPYANTKSVRVLRRDKDGYEQEFKVNAKRVMEKGSPDDDFALEHGDRVIVPARRLSLF